MDLRQRLGPPLAAIGIRAPVAPGLLVAAAVLFLVAANPAWLRSVSLLADITVPPEQPRPNWPLARPQLEPWLAQADVVVTTEAATLYFLGRYDIRFSPSKMGELELGQRHEFGLDYRTGRPVISTLEFLERVLGLLSVGDHSRSDRQLGSPTLLAPELVQLIESRTQPIEYRRARPICSPSSGSTNPAPWPTPSARTCPGSRTARRSGAAMQAIGCGQCRGDQPVGDERVLRGAIEGHELIERIAHLLKTGDEH